MISFFPIRILLILLIISFFSFEMINAQNSNEEENKQNQEFRAAWIASVMNLDWPISRTASTDNQKQQLINIFDSLHESGFNAVFLQVTTEADALYDSEHAPWSYYLTGEEGTPPDPYYDPLEFAVKEAHKRGLELHAWLNPYRAVRFLTTGKQVDSQEVDPAMLSVIEGRYDSEIRGKADPIFPRDSSHVYYSKPEWLITINNYVFLDPGLPEVIQHVKNIAGEIVNNYNVDGIHFDDYFYPYPPNHMSAEPSYNQKDDSTFAAHPRGFDNKDDWRRNNINLLMQEVHDTVKSIKPYVKFGVSPFGIWQSSTPPGVTGLSARTTLYADALMWIEDESVDYLVPQLYWAFGCCQDFGLLSQWWLNQTEGDIHFYAGLGLYKSDTSTFGGTGRFSSDEIPRQIRHIREIETGGTSMFRSRNLTVFNSAGIRDTLRNDLYNHRALTPSFNQIDLPTPEIPGNITMNVSPAEDTEVTLTWERPAYDAENDSLVRYAIYRMEAEVEPAAEEIISDPENLIAITGQELFVDTPEDSQHSYHYTVTAFNRNSNESTPSEVRSSGIITSGEYDETEPMVKQLRLDQNYPNPFNPTTSISFQLPERSEVSLKIYDVVGREVAILVNEPLSAGEHTATFDASSLPSGVYFYRLETTTGSLSRKMTLIK
ncbi:hypothetical protein BH23BAC3_BH23BAC3_05060 [soil metagenome]